MNQVILIGRLTTDPQVRYTSGTQMAVATFTVAIDRPRKADAEKQTDYPRVIVFGKQAENCERFIGKGSLVGIHGRIQTGSYTNKDGATVYTTDVVADRVEFLGNKGGGQSEAYRAAAAPLAEDQEGVPQGFAAIDEEIPF